MSNTVLLVHPPNPNPNVGIRVPGTCLTGHAAYSAAIDLIDPKNGVVPGVGVDAFPNGFGGITNTITVSPYSKIRVFACSDAKSTINVSIRLSIMERYGAGYTAIELDIFRVVPMVLDPLIHNFVTRVYDVPGTNLSIYADPIPDKTCDPNNPKKCDTEKYHANVFVYVYGY